MYLGTVLALRLSISHLILQLLPNYLNHSLSISFPLSVCLSVCLSFTLFLLQFFTVLLPLGFTLKLYQTFADTLSLSLPPPPIEWDLLVV